MLAGRAYKPRPNAPLVLGIRIVTRHAWAYLLILLIFLFFVNLSAIPHIICMSKKLVIRVGNCQSAQCNTTLTFGSLAITTLKLMSVLITKSISTLANWSPENNDCGIESIDASLPACENSQVKKRVDGTVKRNIVGGTTKLHVTSPHHIVSHTLVIQIW